VYEDRRRVRERPGQVEVKDRVGAEREWAGKEMKIITDEAFVT